MNRQGVLLGFAMMLGLGCAQFPPAACVKSPIVRAAAPEELPAAPQPVESAAAKSVVPISLDTVFRLAEENNHHIWIAREKINEAYAEKRVAENSWLLDVYAS